MNPCRAQPSSPRAEFIWIYLAIDGRPNSDPHSLSEALACAIRSFSLPRHLVRTRIQPAMISSRSIVATRAGGESRTIWHERDYCLVSYRQIHFVCGFLVDCLVNMGAQALRRWRRETVKFISREAQNWIAKLIEWSRYDGLVLGNNKNEKSNRFKGERRIKGRNTEEGSQACSNTLY